MLSFFSSAMLKDVGQTMVQGSKIPRNPILPRRFPLSLCESFLDKNCQLKK